MLALSSEVLAVALTACSPFQATEAPTYGSPDAGVDTSGAIEAGAPDASGDGGANACVPSPLDCGACGHVCALGECIQGHCARVVLTNSPGELVGIAVQGERVFFTARSLGKILETSVSSRGQTPTTFYANVGTTLSKINYLALRGDYLVWTSEQEGGIYARLVSGGERIAVATGFPSPLGLAVTPTRTFVTASDSLWEAAPNTALVGAMLLPEGVATDGASVWVAQSNGTKIIRYDLGARTWSVFSDGLAGPAGIAVDATHLYIAEQSGGRVLRTRKDGGSSFEVLATSTFPTGITVDDARVYWTDAHDDAVYAVSK